MWKYCIELYIVHDMNYNLVSRYDAQDGIELCCDTNIAKWFSNVEQLHFYAKTIGLSEDEYGVTGFYTEMK